MTRFLRRVAVFSAFLAMVLPPEPVEALCSTVKLVPPQGSTPAYAYVSVLVDSLSYAKGAIDRTAKAHTRLDAGDLKTEQQLMDAISDVFRELKLAGGEWECAATLVQSFVTNPLQTIAGSAKLAHTVYTTVPAIDARMLAIVRGDLDKPGSRPKGEQIDQDSDLAVLKIDTLKALLSVGILTTYALVDVPKNKEDRLSRLSVSRQERIQLVRQIEESFGTSVRGGPKAGQTAVVGAAATIHVFLSDRGWKALDEK